MVAESMCSGCGAVAPYHPYVGVARDQETGLMTAYPICFLCWNDPSHRQHKLKMHFFDARSAQVAVVAAEDNIMVDKSTVPPPAPVAPPPAAKHTTAPPPKPKPKFKPKR
jgi:hypothetical protein